MSRHWRWLWVVCALSLGAFVGVAPPTAIAQPAPSGSAKAKPPKGDKADAGAPGGDKKKDAGTSSGDAGLPSGHPPVDDQLPSGHPPTGNPRQQRQPEGHGQFFQPPEDVVETDAALPPGTVVFALRDSDDRPVKAQVQMSILHNTVSKGESSNQIARETDDDGQARFDGLEVGAAVSYAVAATRGPGRFETPKFTLDDKAGKRVSLHVYESTKNHDDLRVGMWGVVFVQVRDDVIIVEQHMTLLNVERVAWVPENFVMGLPEDFKAFTVPDGMEIRFKEAKGQGAALEGTITPGQHDTMFRYHVPLDGSDKQSFSIRLPPKVFQIGVMVEVSKNMTMEATGFPAAQRSERNGRRVLVTKKQAAGPGDELSSVEIKLGGLPTQGPARWIAVGLAASSVAFAFFWVKQRRDDDTVDPETVKDLNDAREALILELVELERAHKAGEVGPKSYARIRAGLLDALARIVAQIDDAQSRKPRGAPPPG